MRVVRMLVLGVLILFAAAPRSEAQNLIANPDFNSGLAAWTTTVVGGASAFVNASLGSPVPPSAELFASGASTQVTLSQCVNGVPALVDFGVRSYLNPPLINGINFVQVRFFGAPNCAGASLSTVYSSSPTPIAMGWFQWASAGVAPPGGSLSASFELIVSVGPAGGVMDMMFDHAYYGPAGSAPASLQSFSVD